MPDRSGKRRWSFSGWRFFRQWYRLWENSGKCEKWQRKWTFFCSQKEKDAQISDESDETENLENETSRTGDAVKLSRLDGKHLCLKGNGTGPAVNGNSIGSSSKSQQEKTDYNRSTGQNARDAGSKAWGRVEKY